MEEQDPAGKRRRISSQSRVLRTLSCVELNKVVGTGTFGVVFKAVLKDSGGERVALKKIKMENEKQGFPITAIREIKILKSLHHENIVKLKEIITYDSSTDQDEVLNSSGLTNGDVFMVFEFCDFDLCGLLRETKVVLTEQHIKSYAKQLLSGIHYMHKNKILHRDIKGANILVTRGNVIKIADWGMARSYFGENPRLTNLVVTQWYRSPELLLGTNKYGPEIDIWSVGCLFGEMRSADHHPLFRGRSDDKQHQLELIYQLCGSPSKDLEEDFKLLPYFDKLHIDRVYTPRLRRKFLNCYDEYTLDLLCSLLDLNPKTRISAEKALDSEYFWKDPPKPPELLPQFDLDSAFSLAADEKQREEHRRARQAQEEKQQQQQQQQKAKEGGIAAAPTGRKPGAPPMQSKYKIVKPSSSSTIKEAGIATAAPHSDSFVAHNK